MIIQSKCVYYEERLQPKQIEIRKDEIIGVYPYGLFKADVDYDDLIVMPGLCDVHNHGYKEVAQGVDSISAFRRRHSDTGFHFFLPEKRIIESFKEHR